MSGRPMRLHEAGPVTVSTEHYTVEVESHRWLSVSTGRYSRMFSARLAGAGTWQASSSLRGAIARAVGIGRSRRSLQLRSLERDARVELEAARERVR